MALVIKSWKVQSRPGVGQPYAQVIARESGLISFVLSLLGIDATTTLIVSGQGFEFERGSLSGFLRRVSPYGHVSSVLYGRHKPWKKTVGLIMLSLFLGSSLMGHGTGMTMLGTLVLFGGVGLSLLYYFLNRELTLAFAEDSGQQMGITFKRSVVEGQEIDEAALKQLVIIIEALLRGEQASLPDIRMGGAPAGARTAAAAPTGFGELVRGGGSAGSVIQQPAAQARMACANCGAAMTLGDAFCGSCGTRVA